MKIVVPPGADADQFFAQLAKEVDGLKYFEIDGRSMRVECRNQSPKLCAGIRRLFFLKKKDSGQNRLKVKIDEPQCTVKELCQIVDQQVEELEAI